MGMTIEETIKVIHKMLAYTDLNVRANLNADMIDACHMAIDTMRKYQKIEQILKDIPYGGDVTVRRIQEVVENGTN